MIARSSWVLLRAAVKVDVLLMLLRFTGGGISIGSVVFELCMGAVVGLCYWRDVTIVLTPVMS